MEEVTRKTGETEITLSIDYPAPPKNPKGTEIETGCGFLSHMLTLMSHRGRLGLSVHAEGDLHVDAHHLTEDVGIVLGTAIRNMLTREKISRRRYGWCLLPMDGSLASVALDLSGRGGLFWRGDFPTQKCGDFDMELVPEFFRAFCREARATLHIDLVAVDNSHHAAEAVFKGMGMALDMAMAPVETEPSTKGEWI